MPIANTAAHDGTRTVIKRHAAVVRVTHWITVISILALLMSGLQIFNAHPALYWGEVSTFDDPLLAMTGRRGPDGALIGETHVLDATFTTTGVLGASGSEVRGFPAWATLPSYRDLATGRRWHFFFAWILVINGTLYLIVSVLSRHLWRDLVPSWEQLRHIGRSIVEHMRLRFVHTADYNVLQKLTYLAVILLILPGIVLTGLTMSPAVNAAVPFLTDVLGGRQSARTLHFVFATLIVLFVIVHVAMAFASGFWNNLRSMITGRYVIDTPEGSHDT